MSTRPSSLSLQGWMLAGSLPALGLFVLLQAALLYHRLRDVVVGGFDHELTAISTTVAGFVDPADYRRIVGAPPFGGLAPGPGGDLWALDRSDGKLWRISPGTGLAVDTGVAAPAGIGALASAGHAGRFYLADTQTGACLVFNAKAGTFVPVFSLQPPLAALAAGPEPGVLFAAGRALRRVSAAAGVVIASAPLATPVRSLAWDSRRKTLWALDAGGEELLRIDPTSGAERIQGHLREAGGAEADPLELQTIAYDPAQDVLFGTAASLVRIDPASARVSSDGLVAGFGREQDALYQSYVEPMRRIMARTDLTYLYTQQVEGRDRIRYGIDAAVGAQHSPLLSTDTLRESEIDGVQRLLTGGSVYVSGIENWPVWGQLKSGYAPIFDEHGRPLAMVGADVRAHTIQRQLRQALVITFGFGIAMLVLAGAVTLTVARRVSASLIALRGAALVVGAGDFSPRIRVRRPRDLRLLAERFMAAAARLRRELEEMRANLSIHSQARDRACLAERLTEFSALAAPSVTAPWAWGEVGPKLAGAETASGAVLAPGGALAWIARPESDPLVATERKAEVAAAAQALVRRHGEDTRALAAALADLFPTQVEAWALLTTGGIGALARRSGLLVRVGADGSRTEVAAASLTEPLSPAPGEAIVLAGPDAPLDALPDPSLIPAASGLFAAWRAVAPPDGPRVFAVILVAPEP